MDIEGAEIQILEEIPNWPALGINKLVFEYDFDQDKSIPRFNKIIRQLKTNFKSVISPKMPEGIISYDFYPSGVLVYCTDPKL